MTRRNFIAFISLCVLVTLGLIVVGVGYFATQSEFGQNALRSYAESRVASSISGKVHLGRIHGNFLTGLTLDSLELRDDEDSLVIASGRITVRYDPRDLADRRLYFRSVTLEHPAVVLRQHENWKWNYRKLFRTGGPPKRIKTPERGFADFVQLDSVHIRRGASLRLTIPWHPDDSLRGVKRDSAIRTNIARQDHEVRRTREGFTQTYRWTNAYAFLPYVRVADPDSSGQAFVIDTLHVDESTPPFKWHNVKGVVHVLGDTARLKVSHLELAASTGAGEGKVVWGSDLPVRYDIRIRGDSVSLADIAWVYPTLPTTGVGKMVLNIRNERNLNLLDYAITNMDVSSTKSRLRGNMTFEIGGPVLNVHDVKLVADPVDFDLLRTLNGKPFPADWQGKITGTVTARGGPVTHFWVDDSRLTFRDAHVPGAESRVQGRGELDILFPAFTAFHGFHASTDRLDIRTLAAIYPAFPRMKGIVTGSAVLDSSWLDVRVSNANLTHTDGPAEPNHATGGGRITYGVQFMTYDMTLQASPLSLSTVAQSYPKLPLRGVFSGPVRVRGIAPTLDVVGDLTGPSGHLTYAGKVDADSIGGYGATGAGSFDNLNAAGLFGRTTPASKLGGTFEVDMLGDSLSNLAGPLAVRLDGSDMDGIPISSGDARMRFERGVLVVDTARISSTAGVLRARGTLGLTRAPRDSLQIDVDIDSLGGLRRYLGRVSRPGTKPLGSDSLSGAVVASATLRGWLDSLGIRASLAGQDVHFRGDRAESVTGQLALTDVGGRRSGVLTLRADSALFGGIRLDTAGVRADILDATHARFAGGAQAESGARLRTAGDWRGVGDTTALRLDTLDLALASSHWALRRPSLFTSSPARMTLDTLLFADAAGATVSGFINAPTAAPASARFQADSIPLSDLGNLAQLPSAIAGRMSIDLTAAGTRDIPTMTLTANARDVTYSGLKAELVKVDGGYDALRASMQANVFRGGNSVLDATVSYPIALTLFSAGSTGDSLRGRIHADSMDLALIEAFSPKLRNTKGRIALDIALSGEPSHPHFGGQAALTDGSLEVPDVGLRLGMIDGAIKVNAATDSLSVERLRWTSPVNGGSASLQGSVVYREFSKPTLDLRLDSHGLRAVDKRGLARLDVSTGAAGLTLKGTPEAATLSGEVDVDRGTIYIPELIRKQVVDLTPEDFALLFDTTDVRNRSLMPQPPSALVEHLSLVGVSVRIGDEVWLRSREASIKLGGSLNVTRVRDARETTRSSLAQRTRGDSARYKLALSGTLSADRGTYTLDLTAVQREFQVQTGRITFFGTPDFNPEIDVSALYQLKQANRADIGIKARIHGNFYPQPSLELSSSDAYLSPSDLVSYLVTGRPSFELSGQDVAASQRAFEFVLPSLGASVSRALREQLGGVVDLIQIQSGAVNDPLANSSSSTQFKSILYSTRLGGERQIKDKLFLSFSAGLCQLGGTAATDDPSQQGFTGFANAIEGKLEYRFPLLAPDRFALRAGREPAASALRCGFDHVRGFVATPQQWGFSLFRSWSF
ncbi:MAG: translocation/assembly module TamB domain-containing protein [Gemmatimonadota bacterium]